MRTRLRRLTRMVFRRSDGLLRLFRLGGTRVDFEREVGDPLTSSAVGATVGWIARNFPEAPPALYPTTPTPGEPEQVFDHPMLNLMRRPNDFYGGRLLWMATVTDWKASGNAYWLKVRGRTGAPVQLWWVPSWQMEPKGDERIFITHYVMTVDGVEWEIAPRDVVHFRYGLDPEEPRKGLSPLRAILREVFTDNEAANFTATLLRNMGVPGIIVSPDVGTEDISVEEAEEAKAYLQTAFTGDKRGEPYVSTVRMRVSEFGFSPEQMQLRELRRIPEERITAELGVPAVVVGLGAGLDRSTFTNMAEAREAAYENGIIPDQGIMGDALWLQLLPDFESNPFAWLCGFDLTQVRVLQEDEYRRAQRYDTGVRGGWIQVYEARKNSGLDATDSDRIYLRQAALVEVPADGGEPRSLAPAAQRGSTELSGNGHVKLSLGDQTAIAAETVNELERRELAKPPQPSRRGK